MKTRDGIPGAIFEQNGKIVIFINKKRHYTGLNASIRANWKLSEELKKKIYLGKYTEEKKHKYTIREAFEKYINELSINHSIATVQIRTISFNRIISDNLPLNQEEIEKRIILFLKSNKNLSDASKNTYLQHFQAFLYWCVENELLERIKNFRKKYEIKVFGKENLVFTPEEFTKMLQILPKSYSDNNHNLIKISDDLSKCGQNADGFDKNLIQINNNAELNRQQSLKSFRWYEFRLLLIFLYYSGSRIAEALRINFNDIKVDRIVMHNKEKRSLEYIYLNEPLKNAIEELREINHDKLFSWTDKSKSFMLKKLNELLRACKIDKAGRNIHTFRKSFLYALKKQNVPIDLASKLMRHHKIETTIKHYAKFDTEELKRASQKLDGINTE